MKNERKSGFATTLTAVAIALLLVLPLGAYVGGYLWLGEYDSATDGDDGVEQVSREYPQEWLATIYVPAGILESWLRGVEVDVSGPYRGVL